MATRRRTAETGVWIGIATVAMSFAAFTSAMIVRQGAAPDWRHFQLPSLLYANTVVLLASSVTLEIFRRRAGWMVELGIQPSALKWLYATAALGASFVVGQLLAWRELAARGLFISTNPSASFFYVLTAVHGLHLTGGIIALGWLLFRVQRSASSSPASALAATALYWHFMDVLWLYLMCVLTFVL